MLFFELSVQRKSSRAKSSRAGQLAFAALLLAGCQARPPGFSDAVERNCRQGSADACEMLAALGSSAQQDPDIARPVHAREIVQAILAGMRQARMESDYRDQKQVSPRPGPAEGRP